MEAATLEEDHLNVITEDVHVHAHEHSHSHHEDLGPVAGEMIVIPDVHIPLVGEKRGLPIDLDLLDESEEAKKRRRKNAPPPKKLNEDQWAEMFSRLVKYKEHHGDCLVPKRYQDDPKLGTWVETQRVQYKKLQQDGEAVTPNNRLNSERLAKLESVGFAWSAKNIRKAKTAPTTPSTPGGGSAKKRLLAANPALRLEARQRLHDQTWNDMYFRLVAYKEKYGDSLVPKKFEEDPKLASWVENQRVLYNRDYKAHPRAGSIKREDSNPDPTSLADAGGGKTPEEWALEMERGTTATEEDAAEVAATMAEATMEVVNDVVAGEHAAAGMDDAALAEIAAAAAAASHSLLDTRDEVSAASSKAIMASKRLSQERKEKLDFLGFVWSLRSKRVDDHWDLMFRQLEVYKATHGDCLVPSRYEENYKLGKWVETQRYEYTKLQRAAQVEEGTAGEDSKPTTNPRLTAERRARLEGIGFEWKVKHKMKRYYDRQWDSMFEKLLKFKEENGHCLVPKRYPPDVKLGTWVHTQRIQFRKMMAGTTIPNSGAKKDDALLDEDDAYAMQEEEQQQDQLQYQEQDGEKPASSSEEQFFRLTDERRRRLEEAGFVWSARDSEKSAEPSRITRNSYDDQWDAMFLRLKEYKEKQGDCLVPKRCKEDPKLGTWVDTQRVQYKKMRKKLEKEGVEYVPPALGMIPDATDQDGTSRKPLVGRLTDDRIRRLEGLGFIWSLRDDWQKHYEELTEYKREYGHCNVPARYAKNRRLGIWVSAQRQQFKQLNAAIDGNKPRRSAPLTQDRINLLNTLGFTWTIRSRDSLGESWNQRLEELRQYKDEHGTCLVPSRYPNNPELGIWVGTQRTQYRLYIQSKQTGTRMLHSTAMNEDRIRQLEELGFVWALRSGQDNTWRKHISDLADFRANHGHTAVPGNYKGNPVLGEWAVAMREAYKLRIEGKGNLLDEEKIAELDTLGFGWIEPPQEVADATNNEVTTIVHPEVTDEMLGAGDEMLGAGDETLGAADKTLGAADKTFGAAEEAIQMAFADNGVPPLPPDAASTTGPDTGTTESLIQEAIEHAEI